MNWTNKGKSRLEDEHNMILLEKIKQFINKLFRKEDKKMLKSPQSIEKSEENKKTEQLKKITTTSSSLEEIRKERDVARKEEEIIELLLKNPDAVDNLPEVRLLELEKMCAEKIEENEKKLNELTQKHERMKAKLG